MGLNPGLLSVIYTFLNLHLVLFYRRNLNDSDSQPVVRGGIQGLVRWFDKIRFKKVCSIMKAACMGLLMLVQRRKHMPCGRKDTVLFDQISLRNLDFK